MTLPTDPHPSSDTTHGLGLVLGAGGSLGWAYHLGVLEGIRAATGTEPADADRIVGTSAGGAVAATLMAGATTEEVLASIVAPISPEQREEMGAIYRRTRRRPWRFLRPQAAQLLRRGGGIGVAGLLPTGAFPTSTLRRFPTGDAAASWPERLWLPAVRLDDGAVVVFGRDRTDVAVADALEATSAVPALFQPKHIGAHRFIDGAVASATHADLLSPFALDTVLVASPMTRPGRGLVRRRARRQLRAEVGRLTAAGSSVVVVEPDEAIMAAADGYPRHAPDAGPQIVEAARHQTIEAIERHLGARHDARPVRPFTAGEPSASLALPD